MLTHQQLAVLVLVVIKTHVYILMQAVVVPFTVHLILSSHLQLAL